MSNCIKRCVSISKDNDELVRCKMIELINNNEKFPNYSKALNMLLSKLQNSECCISTGGVLKLD